MERVRSHSCSTCDVAVVDDDPAVLRSFRYLLEVAGFSVATYCSASAFLHDGEVCPRCLIVDQYMPGMTGLELVAALRAAHQIVPTQLVTASPSAAIAAQAARLGIDMQTKPPSEAALLQFVSSCG